MPRCRYRLGLYRLGQYALVNDGGRYCRTFPSYVGGRAVFRHARASPAGAAGHQELEAGVDFEAVDESSLMSSKDSAQVKLPATR